MLDKRKVRLFNLLLALAILMITGIVMSFAYVKFSKDHYVKYTENSDLEYNVLYKDNKFFNDETLPNNNKYIASLIDHIEADFKYNITFLEQSINYTYKYKILANIKVLDNEDKEKIYENNDIIYESELLTGNTRTNINKSVNINYNKYNNLINNFKNTYDLKDVESKLSVNMYIDINSVENNGIEKLDKKAVVSLSMPLTRKTTGIDISSDLTKSNDRKLLIKNNKNYFVLLLIGITEIIISIGLTIIVIIYSNKTKTIKNIYDREIKKILNNYEGYIQKINNKYEIGTSQVIKVESFNDMLEIRDTLKTPILMLENEAKDGTFFIIPAVNGIIYAYALRMIDIIARKKGFDAPDYDLKNIDKKLPKKYTTEFIDKQIEETISMRAINTENTIKGTKDKDENLYDQLDMTITMKPVKTTTRKRTTTKKETEKKSVKKSTSKTKKDEEKKTTKTRTRKTTKK